MAKHRGPRGGGGGNRRDNQPQGGRGGDRGAQNQQPARNPAPNEAAPIRAAGFPKKTDLPTPDRQTEWLARNYNAWQNLEETAGPEIAAILKNLGFKDYEQVIFHTGPSDSATANADFKRRFDAEVKRNPGVLLKLTTPEVRRALAQFFGDNHLLAGFDHTFFDQQIAEAKEKKATETATAVQTQTDSAEKQAASQNETAAKAPDSIAFPDLKDLVLADDTKNKLSFAFTAFNDSAGVGRPNCTTALLNHLFEGNNIVTKRDIASASLVSALDFVRVKTKKEGNDDIVERSIENFIRSLPEPREVDFVVAFKRKFQDKPGCSEFIKKKVIPYLSQPRDARAPAELVSAWRASDKVAKDKEFGEYVKVLALDDELVPSHLPRELEKSEEFTKLVNDMTATGVVRVFFNVPGNKAKAQFKTTQNAELENLLDTPQAVQNGLTKKSKHEVKFQVTELSKTSAQGDKYAAFQINQLLPGQDADSQLIIRAVVPLSMAQKLSAIVKESAANGEQLRIALLKMLGSMPKDKTLLNSFAEKNIDPSSIDTSFIPPTEKTGAELAKPTLDKLTRLTDEAKQEADESRAAWQTLEQKIALDTIDPSHNLAKLFSAIEQFRTNNPNNDREKVLPFILAWVQNNTEGIDRPSKKELDTKETRAALREYIRSNPRLRGIVSFRDILHWAIDGEHDTHAAARESWQKDRDISEKLKYDKIAAKLVGNDDIYNATLAKDLKMDLRDVNQILKQMTAEGKLREVGGGIYDIVTPEVKRETPITYDAKAEAAKLLAQFSADSSIQPPDVNVHEFIEAGKKATSDTWTVPEDANTNRTTAAAFKFLDAFPTIPDKGFTTKEILDRYRQKTESTIDLEPMVALGYLSKTKPLLREATWDWGPKIKDLEHALENKLDKIASLFPFGDTTEATLEQLADIAKEGFSTDQSVEIFSAAIKGTEKIPSRELLLQIIKSDHAAVAALDSKNIDLIALAAQWPQETAIQAAVALYEVLKSNYVSGPVVDGAIKEYTQILLGGEPTVSRASLRSILKAPPDGYRTIIAAEKKIGDAFHATWWLHTPEFEFASDEQIQNTAHTYLNFEDVEPLAGKDVTLEEKLKSNPKFKNYVIELRTLIAQKPEALADVAAHIHADYQNMANLLQLNTSAYGKSNSWALLDIAKQIRYLHNPAEKDPKYPSGDPLASIELATSISDRRLGYEFFNRFKANEPTALAILNAIVDDDKAHVYDQLAAALHAAPASRINHGEPSALQYSEIGALLRKHLGLSKNISWPDSPLIAGPTKPMEKPGATMLRAKDYVPVDAKNGPINDPDLSVGDKATRDLAAVSATEPSTTEGATREKIKTPEAFGETVAAMPTVNPDDFPSDITREVTPTMISSVSEAGETNVVDTKTLNKQSREALPPPPPEKVTTSPEDADAKREAADKELEAAVSDPKTVEAIKNLVWLLSGISADESDQASAIATARSVYKFTPLDEKISQQEFDKYSSAIAAYAKASLNLVEFNISDFKQLSPDESQVLPARQKYELHQKTLDAFIATEPAKATHVYGMLYQASTRDARIDGNPEPGLSFAKQLLLREDFDELLLLRRDVVAIKPKLQSFIESDPFLSTTDASADDTYETIENALLYKILERLNQNFSGPKQRVIEAIEKITGADDAVAEDLWLGLVDKKLVKQNKFLFIVNSDRWEIATTLSEARQNLGFNE